MSELSQHMQDLRDRRLQQEMELAMMDSSSLKVKYGGGAKYVDWHMGSDLVE